MGKEKKEKRKVSVKQAMSYDETISFLEELLKNFKNREIMIGGEENSITVFPADQIQMELKAKAKKDKVKLKLEFGWSEAIAAEADGSSCTKDEEKKDAKEMKKDEE
ncbi:amphi-Trp domain-containing protein [Maridesulfovibrio sp. FT414]|uniref:amphi-Trp domain-containing protein n=1 Tax=Maridesulfovibrio sp. FT414 TaxID=2979469 RepID=UPI003D8060B9